MVPSHCSVLMMTMIIHFLSAAHPLLDPIVGVPWMATTSKSTRFWQEQLHTPASPPHLHLVVVRCWEKERPCTVPVGRLAALGHELIHQGCWQPSKWSVDASTSRVVRCGHHLHQALHIRPSRPCTVFEFFFGLAVQHVFYFSSVCHFSVVHRSIMYVS